MLCFQHTLNFNHCTFLRINWQFDGVDDELDSFIFDGQSYDEYTGTNKLEKYYHGAASSWCIGYTSVNSSFRISIYVGGRV